MEIGIKALNHEIQDLTQKYKKFLNIPDYVEITEDMVLLHWVLEKSLTRELLSSTHENRRTVFERCYTKLYSELPWLNEYVGRADTTPIETRFKTWLKLVGDPPKRIYEVGSGKGELISYLSEKGHYCVATEITEERGLRRESDNLVWSSTDGTHLDQYTDSNYYDIVISNQVIEHLHPEDIGEHFKGVHSILKENGVYILNTPHKYLGPSDLSKIFDYKEPICMHLKEYTLNELKKHMEKAGFKKIKSIIFTPIKIMSKTGLYVNPIQSEAYFKYLLNLEKIIYKLPREVRRLSIFLLFLPIIFISARASKH